MKASLREIADWVQPERCLLDVDVGDARELLALAARAMAGAHGLDAEALSNALARREQAASTALGHGFAIPHARAAGVESPMTAFVRTREALDFKAPDGRPVAEFLVVVVPVDGDREDHLRLLALVSSLFADDAFRRELHRSATPAEVDRAFRFGITRAIVRGDVH